MLGHIMEWFHAGLGGIRQDDSSVAYKHLIIKPAVISGLSQVKSEYHTPYGHVISEWEKAEGGLKIKVSIPVNTSAKVYLPVTDMVKIKESGKKLIEIPDIEVVGQEGEYTVVETGSGSYIFEMEQREFGI